MKQTEKCVSPVPSVIDIQSQNLLVWTLGGVYTHESYQSNTSQPIQQNVEDQTA
jgi:hypothetical protein